MKLHENNMLIFSHFAAGWLFDFSFDWRLKGTLYINDAIAMAIEEGESFFERSFTKDILPAIAKRRGITWRAAERSMRYAIESAWRRGFPEVLHMYFPEENSKTGRPSVSKFVKDIGIAAHLDYNEKNGATSLQI